jgi:hypothetical protein
MEQGSKPAAKPRRKLRAWMVFPLFLLAAWVFCEVYDYVPKRSWFYRQTHTFMFVDATARLEVDGEPLTLTRTIRCINHPRWIAKMFQDTGGTYEPSVFETLGGISKSGRTIIVNVPEACSQMMMGPIDPRKPHDPVPDVRLTPGSYPQTRSSQPTVYEPVGKGHQPDYIYSYSEAVLKDGRYGVRLLEINLSESREKFQLFDRSEYDWMGGGDWYGWGNRSYVSYSAYRMSSDLWGAKEPLRGEIATCNRPCGIALVYRFADLQMFPPNSVPPIGEPIIPVDYDRTKQTLRLLPDSEGRMILRYLPIDADLGIREGDTAYLRYEINAETMLVPYERPKEYMRFISPHAASIIVSSDGIAYYINAMRQGISIRSSR